MIQKVLAWVQIFVIIGGGLVAWGRMSAKVDAFADQAKRDHEEVMQQISEENARILAVEQEVFRAYSGAAPAAPQRGEPDTPRQHKEKR